MPIYELDLKNLGPFDEIHFEFDPKINVFVGPNNCGKSTVQIALGDIALFGFVVPDKLVGGRKSEFRVVKGATSAKKGMYRGELPILGPQKKGYWNSKKFHHWLESLKQLGYTCFIPALRRSTDYRAESAAAHKKTKSSRTELLYETSPRGGLVRRVVEAAPPALAKDLAKREALFETSASEVRDEDLIQSMIDLDYKAYRQRNPAIREILEKIAAVASEITNGFSVEFVGIAEDSEGLYPEFKTPDGKLPVNVLSQGTQSIIQYVGLMLIGYAKYYDFPRNLEKKPGLVIIDEIDAHMHPSWQRRILPALSRNFPNLQIFCSSHSPLVLAGLKAGQAQLLKRDKNGKVFVTRNENDIIGWSTDEILRNFLDITNPTDLQTDESIERLQELRRKRRLTPKQNKELENLRDIVSKQLLTGPVASEVQQFTELIQKGPPRFPLRGAKITPKKTKKKTTGRNKKLSVKSKGK